MSHRVDGQALRQVMRRVPTPVTVVTAAGPEEPRGITIGSFTSVSLDPPLVSFNVEKKAQMHEVLASADRFVVHLLGDEQAHLSNHFALPGLSGDEQFFSIPHRLDEHGIPLLEDALVRFHCRRYACYEAGDHSIFVGEVLRLEDGRTGRALLYHDQAYHRIGEEVQPSVFVPVKRASSEAL